MQSVTIDPLTHERIKQSDKSQRIIKKAKHPAIIDTEMWNRVQEAIVSRINHNLVSDGSKHAIVGIVVNKDIYCRKLRCGCGRRFKKI